MDIYQSISINRGQKEYRGIGEICVMVIPWHFMNHSTKSIVLSSDTSPWYHCSPFLHGMRDSELNLDVITVVFSVLSYYLLKINLDLNQLPLLRVPVCP